MDEIRPWLFIGRYRDTMNENYLASKSINAMLLLAEMVEQPNIVSLYLPVDDIAPVSVKHIQQGVNFIREHKQKGHRILVACGAGINRATAFCAAILKEEENLSLFEAFKQVKMKHPESLPHKPVWESLCEYYEEPVPFLDVMRFNV